MQEVEFKDCLVVAVTDKAFLISHPDADDPEDAEWFPKSQVDWTEPAEKGDRADFYIPEWLADKKGWQ